MIKVMIVDDHVLIRKGLLLLLQSYSDIEIVGEAGDGEEAILCAERTNPDIILMDISIPSGLDGFTATQEIMKQNGSVKVILLTMHNEMVYIQKAIDINAHGYLLKNSQGGELYQAIKSVYNGKKYYSVGLPQEQIEKMFKRKGKDKSCILTIREQEVVRLTILGYTNMQIAVKLLISVKTVENHKANIMQKLNLKNKSELIQYGLSNNYLELV
ncbi:response regulator [Mesobacillus zeae]|uniref:DNA-binding response regulator n=1 Tax=Mesobacillus zeae TaxID=1917180 RepID=A0A398B6J5_9BACI|nr:response regulator transcription factor [Mesobacillus zeae]RID85565.1 DNA-binding response regulator [Mesobacillus zeae]